MAKCVTGLKQRTVFGVALISGVAFGCATSGLVVLKIKIFGRESKV